ncbi:carbonic anhydrase 4-like [Anabas testudineus]|uniref:Carbonic anhydrase n=1 Tax=Anabas testudineus TaxID=64144 RepID=A0A3Q1J491_ANATE|nr:carbonic anhydrase 4-like [Anabas testudineus]
MYQSSLLLCLCLGAVLKCAAGAEWCYTGCAHTPTNWGDLPGSFCGGKRQSPIDIITSKVQKDPDLVNFSFVNMSQPVKSIKNNGHTVQCTLEDVQINGGGLNGTYSTTQFHLHWGDTEHHPGSEHMIDGERYPMEMHVVSVKKGLTLEEALADPQGIAVLGFFINGTDDGDLSGPWSVLTSLLPNATATVIPVIENLTLDDLIGNVDLTKFYRYMGSLTTPNCTEAVAWTVFHEPININKNLIQQFPVKTGLTNIYRPTQDLNNRHVSASPATPLPPSHPWCYGHCEYSVSHWDLLPHSSCGGSHQSPVNIVAHGAVRDKRLNAFTYTNFDNRSAIKSISNSGHTVMCELREDLLEVSGGGLGHVYSTFQLHFHWGTAQESGSEHTVDSKRYTMEMHIVSKRKDLTLDEALQTPNGLAVLGFFIESHPKSSPSVTNAWETLTSYLPAIQNISSAVDVKANLSIDDLLGNVNRAAYYRYNGSLTTPSCNEAVVWTVFEESVKVDQNLITMFPSQIGYFNVFRPTQSLNGRTIYTTKSSSSAPGPIMMFPLLACLHLFV